MTVCKFEILNKYNIHFRWYILVILNLLLAHPARQLNIINNIYPFGFTHYKKTIKYIRHHHFQLVTAGAFTLQHL